MCQIITIQTDDRKNVGGTIKLIVRVVQRWCDKYENQLKINSVDIMTILPSSPVMEMIQLP